MAGPYRLIDVDYRDVPLFPADKVDVIVDGRAIPVLVVEPDGKTLKLLVPSSPRLIGELPA